MKRWVTEIGLQGTGPRISGEENTPLGFNKAMKGGMCVSPRFATSRKARDTNTEVCGIHRRGRLT